MAGKRRNAPKPLSSSRPQKKQQAERNDKKSNGSQLKIPELYDLCVMQGDDNARLDNIKTWEERGALKEVVWPFLVGNQESREFVHGCHLAVLFVSHHFWEGSFGSYSLDFMDDETTIHAVLKALFLKTDHKNYALQTQIVHFLIVALSSSNETLCDAVTQNLTGVGILHWMPDRRRELELKKSAGLRRKFTDSKKESMWLVQNVQRVLQLLEGHTEYGMLLRMKEKENDVETMTMDVPLDVWNFLHRSLELLIDLLSASSSRLFLVTYLDSIHFGIRARLAVGNQFAIPENLRLIQHLLGRINGLLAFPIEESTKKHLSKVDVVSMYHSRATILQKMAHRHYPQDLQSVIYAGVGLLCAGQQQHSYLQRALIGLSDDALEKLLYKMCLLPDSTDKMTTRQFMLQVLGNYLSIPPYPMDQLRAFPLYPTESMLWDHSVIPPSTSQLRVSQVLALPKLNSKFLSFQDYLLRNFELVRLESAYEIRSDLVNVVKRVRPLLRQSALEESEDIELTTEFTGWSRMSLEMDKPLTITEVQPPALGQTVSAQVSAEVVIDLERCGDSIRREWDEIGEYDNLFLVAIDASKMSGNPAPLLKDYHLRHGAHKMWDSDNAQKRVPDEEDSTFPERFGITMVRGCMVLNVRNGAGTLLSDPGVQVPEGEKENTKRIFKVVMDSAQYELDKKSENGTEAYKQFNLVVRRHGRENNFKSVLETVRGLMEGAGSIERVIPPWLQSLVLGSGDNTTASYKSPSMKEYARNTVGVNKPGDYLDFGDTFLDEAHLRDSFDGEIIVDGEKSLKKQKDQARANFKIQVMEEGSDGKTKAVINGVRLPFPEGVPGNAVRFTPRQVEAIHSGLSPGLTLVVGPPGTGE
eukprot:scaffold1398_cov116-Cylindrotheca_fusiformis.AAC.1